VSENKQQEIVDAPKPLNEQSPDEKLRDTTPIASEIPGAENPESEIKSEVSPNSE